MTPSKKHIYQFIITGGGTGGHIFPAIAIAKALEEVAGKSNVRILFIGAKGKIETKLIPAAGFPIKTLSIVGMPRNKNIFQLLRFVVLTFASLFSVKKWIKKTKPDAVIGVGGYASFATLYMAQKMKIPTFIQEQNAFVGIVNKALASKASYFFGGYEHIQHLPACRFLHTGNPVRKDIQEMHHISREQALAHFGWNAQQFTILIIGGSQGARALNQAIAPLLSKMIAQSIHVIWQTGEATFPTYKNTECANSSLVHITPFISDMAYAYRASDLIISRAGALSVAELALAGKPSILVPLSTAAEDHQTYNAEKLRSKEAAILIPESQLNECLWTAIEQLLQHPSHQATLAKNIQSFAVKDADLVIAKKIIETLEKP